MNSVNLNTSVSNQNYQIAFNGKVNKKNLTKIVDELGFQMPQEFILRQRPIEEQKETLMRRYISKFMEIFSKEPKDIKEFREKIEKMVADGVIDADYAATLLFKKGKGRASTNKLVETANKASRQVYLDELRKRDPELFKEVLRRESKERFALMSNWDIVKDFLKNLEKKS